MRLFKLRRDPTDPVDRVDRFWRSRRLRFVAGLSVDDEFAAVSGVVVQAQGEGKYLHFSPLATLRSGLRSELSSACASFCRNPREVVEFEALRNDLAVTQVDVLNRLRMSCGAAVGESLLAVSLLDPGVWARDFDGKPMYASFCNPDLLSAHSGVSVIDALPAKDLVAGGHGWPLTPLACWLLAADRSSPVAQYGRLFVHLSHTLDLYFLPVSDGLDDEYPQVRFGRMIPLRWPAPRSIQLQPGEPWWADPGSSSDPIVPSLMDAWSEVWVRCSQWAQPLELESEMSRRSEEIIAAEKVTPGSWSATARYWAQAKLASIVAEFQLGSIHDLQVIVASPGNLPKLVGTTLRRILPQAAFKSVEDLGFATDSWSAVLAAALGAMHIDQMPANLPWLTGAETPRILGRLTPGSPKQWRMLLCEMADHHPGTMRLRDAV